MEKMKPKKIALAVASSIVAIYTLLSLSSCASDVELAKKWETEQIQTDKQKIYTNTMELSGIIKDVDEDSFAIASSNGSNAGIGNFQYEILYIESDQGIKKILAPQPTEYRKNDLVNILIAPDGRIDFQEILEKFTPYYLNNQVLAIQAGHLDIDGVLLRKY
jgi:hypothetical protein